MRPTMMCCSKQVRWLHHQVRTAQRLSLQRWRCSERGCWHWGSPFGGTVHIQLRCKNQQTNQGGGRGQHPASFFVEIALIACCAEFVKNGPVVFLARFFGTGSSDYLPYSSSLSEITCTPYDFDLGRLPVNYCKRKGKVW